MANNPFPYTEEIAEEICGRIATGESIISISKRKGMPSYATIRRWIRNNEDFQGRYILAKEDQAEYIFEQILNIADDGSEDHTFDSKGNLVTIHENINRSRLRVDARKWAAAHLLPKKYGDRLDLDVKADVNVSLADGLTKARERLRQRKDKDNGE